MSENTVIPEELHEFLRRQYGQTMIITGNSGSGKTVLALSLLRELLNEHYEPKNYLFVTSRVPAESMKLQFTWMNEILGDNTILDLSSPSSVADPSDPNAMISDELTFLSVIDERIRKTHYPVCVIDTIESLAEVLNTDVDSLVSSLARLSRESFAKMIIISENEDEHKIEFAVDAVIELGVQEEEGYVWRSITLKKLRGTRIKTRTRGFTITDDGFSQLHTFDNLMFRKYSLDNMTPHSGTRFYSGVKAFDEVFKGFRLGSTCFFEVGPKVDSEVVITLLLSTITNFVAQDGGVIVIPPNKMTFRTIKSAALKYEFFDRLNSHIRMVAMDLANIAQQEAVMASEPYMIFTKGTNEELLAALESSIKDLRSEGCKDIMIVVGLGFLQTLLDMKELSRWVMDVSGIAAQDSGLSITVGYHSTPEINEVNADIADVHIRFDTRASTTIVQGIRPKTSRFCLYMSKEDGGMKIEFQEIS